MDQAKKFLRFFLGVPLTLLSFLFIFKILLDNKDDIGHSIEKLDPLLFVLGILFFSLFFFVKSFIWIGILKKRGFTPEIRRTIYNYNLSEVKRYIPGSIFAFVGRVGSHSESVPKKETLKAIGIEIVLLILSAGFISIPALKFTLLKTPLSNTFHPQLLIVTSFLLIAGVFILFYKFRKTLLSYLDSFLLFLLAWTFYALGCFFVAISLTILDPAYIVTILSLFTLSWLCGYLFFITPMGLGVRELALIFGLSFFTPVSIASAIALLTRIGMIGGELIYLLFSKAIKDTKNNSVLFKIDPFLTITVACSFVYFILFSTLSLIRHNVFLSGRFDLGNMTQTVWNTAHGNFFTLTNPDGIEQISRLGVHSDLILVFFAPLFYIWSDPGVLLITQSLVISIGGIFVYLLSEKIIVNKKISLILALSYLTNFWIHQQNLFDFHAVTLATGVLLAAFYFLIKKSYKLFLLSLFIALLTKENVFLVSAVFGIFIYGKQNKKLGIGLLIVSLLLFYIITAFAIPNARGTEHFALSYYLYLGDSFLDILKNLFVKPQLLFSHLLTTSTITYFHELLIPTGYIALLSPLYLIFALPDFAIYLLSSNENLRMHYYHYGALIVPFIYVSTIYGIKFIINKTKYRNTGNMIFYYLLTALLLTFYLYSPLPGMREADYRIFSSQNSDVLKKYLALIPPDASVSASNNIGAHLSQREKIYVMPYGINFAEYVVLHGASKSVVNSIDILQYDSYVSDPQLNFYIFKKKTSAPCSLCTP